MKTLILILILSIPAFPCGAPQDIYGRIFNPLFIRSTVTVTDGFYSYSATTNAFGYFRFSEMTPCVVYTLNVRNKWFSYPSPTFLLPGEHGVEVTLDPLELNIRAVKD